MERHIDRWSDLLLEECGSDWSPTLNFTNWADGLVFDILGDVCFGKSFEIKEPGENLMKEVPHAITRLMSLVYATAKSPILSLIPILRPWGLFRVLDMLRSKEFVALDNFVETNIQRRIDEFRASKTPSAAAREDMFHFLCTAVNPDTGLSAFTDGELSGEAKLLLVAGSDSTTVILCGLFFYLAHYPAVLEHLANEIRAMFDTPNEIVPGPQLQSCKYLRACIDEGLRISPAGLSELPREVLPGGIRINGEYFPAGTVVGTASWTDGRNEEVYGDPEIFRPERWIPGENNTVEEVSRIRAAFHPFSMGPFNCAGSNFALQELMLIVAKTVHRFEVRPAPGCEEEGAVPHYPLTDAYITVHEGPMLQFRMWKKG